MFLWEWSDCFVVSETFQPSNSSLLLPLACCALLVLLSPPRDVLLRLLFPPIVVLSNKSNLQRVTSCSSALIRSSEFPASCSELDGRQRTTFKKLRTCLADFCVKSYPRNYSIVKTLHEPSDRFNMVSGVGTSKVSTYFRKV